MPTSSRRRLSTRRWRASWPSGRRSRTGAARRCNRSCLSSATIRSRPQGLLGPPRASAGTSQNSEVRAIRGFRLILHGALSTATLVLSWALGGACILLGAFTVDGWLRRRDRTRAFLALSIVLLCGCGVAVGATMLSRDRAAWTSELAITLFLASGLAFFGFRAAMDRLAVAFSVTVGAVVVATVVLVGIAGTSFGGAQSTGQRLVVVLLAAVWLGCVVEPAIRLWGISATLPGVQRARLRSITLAYGGVVVALLLSIGMAVVFGRDHP